MEDFENIPMNPEVKNLWVDALRSGNYRQGLGKLRQSSMGGKTSFCCLGVLCDLYQTHSGKPMQVLESGETFYYQGEYHIYSSFLPEEVQDWAGIHTDNVLYLKNGRQETLTHHNDKDGFDFNRIADVIEENF